jgi:ABC-2 type transport system permease protein
MNSETPLERVTATGWRLGLANLFKKEAAEWLETRRWGFQLLLWVLLLNGFLAAVLFVLPAVVAAEGQSPIENPAVEGAIGFFGLGGMAIAIGIVILTQNEMIGERQSGTAEWVLSKPASRAAFYLSKLGANLLGMLVVMIVAPSAVALALLGLYQPGSVSVPAFLAGGSILALHATFYLTLTLALGVFASSREMVLAVSLGLLLGGMIARNFVGGLALVTPWLLSDLAGLAAVGGALGMEMWLPVAATAVWSLALVALALWRFERLEF